MSAYIILARMTGSADSVSLPWTAARSESSRLIRWSLLQNTNRAAQSVNKVQESPSAENRWLTQPDAPCSAACQDVSPEASWNEPRIILLHKRTSCPLSAGLSTSLLFLGYWVPLSCSWAPGCYTFLLPQSYESSCACPVVSANLRCARNCKPIMTQ